MYLKDVVVFVDKFPAIKISPNRHNLASLIRWFRGPVLKMTPTDLVAEDVEDTAEGPHVGSRVDGEIVPSVDHFGSSVRRRRVPGHLLLEQATLLRRPVRTELVELGSGTAEVAKLDAAVARHKQVFDLQVAVDGWLVQLVQRLHRPAGLSER